MDPVTLGLLLGIPAVAGLAGKFFDKKPKFKTETISNYSPEQRQLFDRLLGQLSPEVISDLFGPITEGQLQERFNRTTGDPARRQFTEQLVPEPQELFTSAGGRGGDAEQYQLAAAG